jgi:hypothetical protein
VLGEVCGRLCFVFSLVSRVLCVKWVCAVLAI